MLQFIEDSYTILNDMENGICYMMHIAIIQ